ncbi:bifunctional [glutamine synthetase] adenylyltransferase/[glutamine synthetase]-adenylyl-L-tyrosine phosphorylase [Planctomonas psychrotolerans]|uniref:bifunctional [glutamine synthetase] adenylyltransferase/[glutamine synthetase]-adenylyl-L-tyrosine phosphorylase n=1 Tax=Planctomonas psychrotolerans TaxID=2528712 RepID=UPI001238902C|nr:bifunctional [glutamine synthetase] adenylyltransferase/[glutamine synthetase]-adenylyl-L-tyrosine phosphorylase [Planctomonas psychrotolerans]
MRRDALSLSELAKAGFAELSATRPALDEAAVLSGEDPARLLRLFSAGADADGGLRSLIALLDRHPEPVRRLLADDPAADRLVRVLCASSGLAEFFLRNPDELEALVFPLSRLPEAAELRADLLDAVGVPDGDPGGFARLVGDEGRMALRVRYRRHLARIAAYDLTHPSPLGAIAEVTAYLADLAGAALDASLAVARAQLVTGGGPGRFGAEEIADTRLAIIGMGKAGARELNYVSDVDVIFVGEADDTELTTSRAIDVASRLAVLTMRGIDESAIEPALWEVDANLRPEGKAGVLVRTLDSHLAYYDRWAKGWEFQALLKARPLAGDPELGARYVEGVAPKVWISAGRENFVESVQRMRQRVAENIPRADVDHQLKLGPGGLRDIEFTVQLLQLVHGQNDDAVRQGGTLRALHALASRGYIGRRESAEFAEEYRFLRLLEHRLQLQQLRRTHLMPRAEDDLRILARSTGLVGSAAALTERWNATKAAVRTLHERLFYRPLLTAVAALPEEDFLLTSEQATARLAAIGFTNAKGALAHIGALTQGVSRRATIQRNLLPVMLQWLSAGTDPDYGLLEFRRLSEALGESSWFLRMLRDSSGAAQRLMTVLSGSRFVGDLLERIPEAAAWFDDDDELRPRTWKALNDEAVATVNRHATLEGAAVALRTARRREVLRLAIGAIVGLISVEQLGRGLSDITTALLRGLVHGIRQGTGPWPEFAIIAMGRYGGGELGFGSDADVMYVFRPIAGMDGDLAHRRAQFVVSELNRLSEDARLPLDLDIGLRPEGKNGPAVRSLTSYRSYYERWSLTWEAQALLRARGVVGDLGLLQDFSELADRFRYPEAIGDADVREIKRIKARVENERLPQGADPARHLKLGRGSLSDVEWYVQLLQLREAHRVPGLRTPSTLEALAAAADAGLVPRTDAERLRDAWIFASRARSAMTLWTSRTADVLPTDRLQLEGVARLLEYPPHSATRLEEDYLGVTRRARAVFERGFYGVDTQPAPTPI